MRLFLFHCHQFGSSYTYSLLKGAIGNFDDFVSRCGEDVVVLGHTHEWRGHRIKNRTGKAMYINTGCWIDYAHEVRLENKSCLLVVCLSVNKFSSSLLYITNTLNLISFK